MKKEKGIISTLLLVVAAFFWGTTFVAQKIAGDYQGPFTFCAIRNLMAAVFLTPLVLSYEKKKIAEAVITIDEKNKERKLIMQGGVLTGIFLAGTDIFQQLGIYMGTGAGKAGFLTSCYIVLVPIIGLFIGKKCKWTVWISVLIAIVGIYFLCINERLTISTQDAFILICSLACALQITFVDYFAPKVSNPIRLAQMEFFVCGCISAAPMVIFEVGMTKEQIVSWGANFYGFKAWIPLLYATIFSSVVAYTLQIVAQKNINATVASLVMSLESVFAVIAGSIVVGERMNIREGIGCILVFIAVILSQLDLGR